MATVVGVVFQQGGKVYSFDPAGLELHWNENVICQTARGRELGRVVEPNHELPEQELTGITPSTEAYALLFARKIRGKLATTWAVGETGTAGPTGSRYGHAAGHSCIAVIGPNGERSITVETGNSDRLDNMRAFSIAALDLLEKGLG